MKKTVIVTTHQENQENPIAADEASVSIVRMAQTVKRTRSARPRTRSRAGTSCAAEEPVRASKSHDPTATLASASTSGPCLAALAGRVIGSGLLITSALGHTCLAQFA